MVAAGVGVSLLPSFALANVRDDIVVRSLGRNAPAREIAAATLAGGYRSPATDALLDILREVASEFELPAGAAVAAA
jgi:DNA-binding transcriptional LysR family regulator